MFKHYLFIFLILFFSSRASKAAKNPQGFDASKELNDRYAKLKIWEAKFSYETFSTALGSGTYSEGDFLFEAPNKLRMRFTQNPESDFYWDQIQAWNILYNHKLKRKGPAEVKHYKDVSKLELEQYLFFLNGQINPKESQTLARFENGLKVIEWLPKTPKEIVKVKLFLNNSQIPPEKIELEDALGDVKKFVILSFKVIEKKNLSKNAFQPIWPKGSKVVNP